MIREQKIDISDCGDCGFSRVIHSATQEWCPGTDARPNVEYPRRVFTRRHFDPDSGRKHTFRCEHEGCEETRIARMLPSGWSQTGYSRFPDAVAGIAAWCEKHNRARPAASQKGEEGKS